MVFFMVVGSYYVTDTIHLRGIEYTEYIEYILQIFDWKHLNI